jgi:hypothetical protein
MQKTSLGDETIHDALLKRLTSASFGERFVCGSSGAPTHRRKLEFKFDSLHHWGHKTF